MKKIIIVLSLAMLVLIGCSHNMEDQADIFEDNKYELKLTNGDRSFKSEVAPSSMGEKVILDYYKFLVSDDFDQIENITTAGADHSARMLESLFEQGKYPLEKTIHSFKKIDEKEYKDVSSLAYYENYSSLKKSNPLQFEIIMVDYTVKQSTETDAMAGVGSGNWINYFVVGKNKLNSNWKIYDIYGIGQTFNLKDTDESKLAEDIYSYLGFSFEKDIIRRYNDKQSYAVTVGELPADLSISIFKESKTEEEFSPAILIGVNHKLGLAINLKDQIQEIQKDLFLIVKEYDFIDYANIESRISTNNKEEFELALKIGLAKDGLEQISPDFDYKNFESIALEYKLGKIID